MPRRKHYSWMPPDFRSGPEVFKRRLSSAQAEREQQEDWWRLVEGLYGDVDIEQWTTSDFAFDMSSGFVVSTLDTVISGVSQPNPKITLTPTVPGQEDFAMVADRLVNSYWTRFRFGRQFLMGVFDAESKGLGIWKTLWKREVDNVLLSDQRAEALVQEALTDVQTNPAALVGGR